MEVISHDICLLLFYYSCNPAEAFEISKNNEKISWYDNLI
jgi:hypothetical protein